MSIERFIECQCRHSIELHEGNGCLGTSREDDVRCSCLRSRSQVLDLLFDAERDTIQHAWRPVASESGGQR